MNSLADVKTIAEGEVASATFAPAFAPAPAFARYAAYYDALYGDKDYAAEAEYVAWAIRSAAPAARGILELGSGTGRHGRLLAAMGFDVHGIERSREMVAIARAADDQRMAASGDFSCEPGDLCTIDLGRTFDAVIALFHVISYQTTNDQLLAAFSAAARHLDEGGLFLFDVWHGPAVLSEKPGRRIKHAANGRFRVARTASPELDAGRGTVNVVYGFECEDLSTGEIERFDESHLMRYLFPTEVDLLARSAGFTVLKCEEFMTGLPPTLSTWGVTYLLRK